MNYATQKTRRADRYAAALLSLTITLTITGGIVFGMTGGVDTSSLGQMAARQAPAQVVAQR